MNGRNVKKIILLLTAGLLAAGLAGCRESETEETETVSQDTPVIEIAAENETVPEEEIVLMAPGGDVLPVLSDVTTAAENSLLSPVYLREGVESPIVVRLQEKLMKLGYMDNDEPTQYYGTATTEAVKYFQRQIGAPQDGVVGAETWDKLFSADTPFYQVKNGDSGNDIVQIQNRLYQLGYISESSVTGYYGDNTEKGVKDMQARNGITVDGTVGKETINLIYSDEVKANLIGIGDKSELVQKYQQRLIALGYLYDEADGTFGAGTQSAVMQFQSRNDQIVDGYLGPDTRIALESPNAKPFGLRLGDKSSSVTNAQKRLAHYGYLPSNLVTGYYGEITVNAVVAFQECNGLSADGTVGIQTMTKLLSDTAVKKPAGVTVDTNKGGEQASSQAAAQQTAASQHSDAGSAQGQEIVKPSAPEVISAGAQSLINVASTKLGCPYVWGSKGPGSFDCSGFVYWCLNQVGVSQSYLTSSGWRNPGRYEKVSSFDSIRAGDIVVVSGHVGIAAGGGTIIDASSSNGRVVHRSLSDWWRNNFITAWRIF
ncbi:MAG: peptidoglycan-binding protein [Lachnospiraceae bacterium]|nr:peptidoglycan-binding protein [Lachnospiraceae bacterium]